MSALEHERMRSPPAAGEQGGDAIARRLAFGCALLLAVATYLPLARDGAAAAARVALLLFPVAGAIVWVTLPRARRSPAPAALGETWRWIGWPMLAWFSTALITMLVHRDSLSVLDKPVRALLAGAGLYVWLHLRMDAGVFRRVAIAASLAAGWLALGVAGYEHAVLGIERVGVQSFPIQFADMAMSVALIGAVLAATMTRGAMRFIALAGAAAALVAVTMAATRGALVALIVLPAALAYARDRRVTFKVAAAGLATLVLVAGLGATASSHLRGRLSEVYTDLRSYSNGHVATSLGMRLQMWENSARVFARAPLFGVGQRGYLESQEEGVKQGRLDPAILEYNSAHNQYIDALAKGGLLHFASTLALFLAPWLWFRRRCRLRDGDVPMAAAGFALTSSFTIYALTQHVLNHGSGPGFLAGGALLFAFATALREPQAAAAQSA